MVFSSMTFLCVFFPVVFALYYILPGLRARNVLLILASLLFYAYGEPVYVLLMIFSIVMNYFSRSFFADSSYMLSFSVLCSCVCSRLISPSVSSWHKQDNTLMHQSPGHIQRRTPYNF